jgi:hypothetical protein
LLIAPERNRSMKKLALVLLTTTLLGLPAAPAMAEGQPVDCGDPIPVSSYDEHLFSYGMAFDYSTCSWWDGGTVELDATLSRLDAEGEEIANVVSHCGAMALGDVSGEGGGLCEVGVELEHPPVEVARYRGEITFPWKDGEKTLGFTVVCNSPTLRCQDA